MILSNLTSKVGFRTSCSIGWEDSRASIPITLWQSIYKTLSRILASGKTLPMPRFATYTAKPKKRNELNSYSIRIRIQFESTFIQPEISPPFHCNNISKPLMC